MRIKKDIAEKDGTGSVRISAEVAEDMWHVYNIVQPGDEVTAGTTRKISKDTSGAAGGSELVRVKLTVIVTTLEFDADQGILRVSGKVCKENPHVKKGAFHTLELGPASAHGSAATRGLASVFTIQKECWDSEFLRRINEASKPASNAEVLGMAMSTSQATICLVTEHMTVVRKTLEPHIPKARGDGTGRKAAIASYFEQAYRAMKEAAGKRFPSLKLVVLAGPGFTKNDFFAFAMDHAAKLGDREVMAARSRFVMVEASGAHKRSLEEALRDPVVEPLLADTKAASEVRILDTFWQLMREDEDRALYGPRHVAFAADAGAVETLLICDALLRSTDPAERRFYVKVAEDVADNGGTVSVFSSSHASGEALTEITGIAAICRSAIEGIDEMIDAEQVRGPGEGGGQDAAAASSSAAPAAAPAMAALTTGADGSLRLRDDAESVTTTNSSTVGWELAEGDLEAAAACRAELARAISTSAAGSAVPV